MIYIVETFISITTAAMILLSSFTTIEAGKIPFPCDGNHLCPYWLACRNRICVDLCPAYGKRDQECTMEDHVPVFRCKRGYETPKNSIDDICLPVEWSCHADLTDPDRMIKCNSPKWFCQNDGEHITCGVRQ